MIREVSSNELYTLLLVCCLLIVAAAKLVSEKRFNDFIYIFTNWKYLKIYARDQKFFDKFDALLFVNLIISGSLFIIIAYQHFNSISGTVINVLFKITVGLGSFFLIKVLLERLIGSLFEIDKIIDDYLFQKITYKNYLGMILLPINALLIYSIRPNNLLFYMIFGILLVVTFTGLITSFKRHQSLIKNNIFYFILYLCALEIAPCVILYKVFILD
ncbi:DUF4271 domain-containing protein [Aestuariivivens sediminicola]|uniref:DUF4271 domain-containing protein n=1 Tax=Aestuariivivens sediminicola TaxID=2913560 RepID=UPI001F57ECD9|nr:DUF4271 domain-containing protein [Aestuariivivens sediminicola]